MNIQIISNLFPVSWDPNRAAFNRQQFSNLAENHTIETAVIVPWRDYFKHRPQNTSLFGLSITHVCNYFVPKVLRFSYPLTLFLSLLPHVPSIRKFNPDCFILSWAFPDAVSGIVIAGMLNRPAIIKVHGSDVNMHMQHSLRRFQVVWAMKKAAKIVCVSRDLANKLEHHGVPKEQIEVIYNGVNHELFFPREIAEARTKTSADPARTTLLYIGNLITTKGCIDLFTAFQRLVETHDTIDLVYIGKGVESATLKSNIAENSLEDRIKLLGSIPHEQLPSWICSSSLVILPSYNEGVPNVLLEAMACGTPVVATRVGGIPEVVPSQAGLLVKAGDIDELVQAIEEGLAMKWDKKQIANCVSDFSWQNNTKKMSDILNSITSETL